MGDRRIDDDRPHGQEHRPSGELEAVGDRAGGQGRSDHREHHLIGDEREGRNRNIWRDDVERGGRCVLQIS